MSSYKCPSCQHPLKMDQLVRALLTPTPMCPECDAPLPEDVREFVDLEPPLPQSSQLADQSAEPPTPFAAEWPDPDTVDLDVPHEPQPSDTAEMPYPTWQNLADGTPAETNLDDIDQEDTVDIPISALEGTTLDMPGGAMVDLDAPTVVDDLSDSERDQLAGDQGPNLKQGADQGVVDLDKSTVDLQLPENVAHKSDNGNDPNATVDENADDTNATVDEDADDTNATVDEDADDPNATIAEDAEDPNATVDEDAEDPNATIAEDADDPNATVAEDAEDLSATVSDDQNVTIDEGADEEADELVLSESPMDRDRLAAAPLAPQGEPTMLDPPESPKAGAPVHQQDTLKDSPPTKKPGSAGTVVNGKTVSDGASENTVVGMDSRLLVDLPKMWATVDRNSRPGATIRGEDLGEITRSNLVIQTRELRTNQAQGAFEHADYQLLKQLGEGGMGVVFAARQASIDRTVAIKMLKAANARSDIQRGKFLSEAVVTGELDHPNIVPIYDLGTNTDGSLFYSMKRVEGTPWNDVVATRPLHENLSILMKVADAVAFAHDKGVIHRDLKPENVMLGDFGEVLVMDWGLAAPFQSHGVRSAGGTPAYMSPEMAAGPYEEIGVRSDVYLLGAILFEVLVGRPPHTGQTVMKCLTSAAKNEIRPTDVSGELMNVAMRAMQSAPHDRFASVKEFQHAIQDYLNHTESIDLANRSQEELQEGKQSGNYESFARAVFGFQESLNLWPKNPQAATGLVAARRAYAELASHNADFDLAASLLDPAEAEHQSLLLEIQQSKSERDARKQRLRTAKRAMVGLGLALGVVVTGAFFMVNSQRNEALRQKGLAVKEKAEAETQRKLAIDSKNAAIDALNKAETAKSAEEVARKKAVKAQGLEAQARLAAVKAKDAALLAKAQADTQRKAADDAREKEAIARQQEQYEAYVARIGLAKAKIDANAFGQARQLLAECPPDLRNWEWGRLMFLCTQDSQSLDAGAPIEAIALHEMGERRWLASGGRNGEVRIWDLNNAKLLATLRHQGQYVTAVAFSPDGETLATGSNSPDAFVQLWDWKNAQQIRQWKGHEDAVLSVAFSPDGAQLLTSSYDHLAKLWEVATGDLVRSLVGHTWWVWTARFSPSGDRIVTAGQDGLVFVWETETGKRQDAFAEHEGPVFAAAFSPDGRQVASGGNDKVIRLWDPDEVHPYNFKAAASGELEATPHQRYIGHQAAIRDIHFSAGRLISGAHDNAVMLWDVVSGKRLTTLRGHDSWIRSCWISKTGEQAVSGSFDHSIKVWSIAGYEEQRVIRSVTLAGHDDAVLGADFSPQGDKIVTASRDRTSREWDAASGRALGTLREGHSYLATRGAFLNQGKWLATAAVDNTVRLWDVATGTELNQLEHTGRGAALSASQDGQWLVTGGDSGEAKVWRVAELAERNVQPTRIISHLRSQVSAVAISSDGDWIAIGEASGRTTIWSDRGELHKTLSGPTRRITGLAFLGGAHQGDLLVASDDHTVSWWNPMDGTERRERLLRHSAGITSLAVAGNGQRAATCDANGVARVWDLKASAAMAEFKEWELTGVTLNQSGSELAGVDPANQAVHIWNVDSRREVRRPTGHVVAGTKKTDGDSATDSPALDLSGRGQVLWSAQFAGDDAILIIGGDGASIWDRSANRMQVAFRPHGAVASAKYSPDGRMIVTASWDHSARLWDSQTKRAIRRLGAGDTGHMGYVNSATFSARGTHVATASDDGTIIVWQTTDGKKVTTLRGHRGRVMSAVFTSRGDQLLSASMDGEALLWNLRDGSVAARLKHPFGVRSAEVSLDGDWIVTGCDDNRGRIWKRQDDGTFSLAFELSGHTAPVQSVSLSPNGTRVITGSADYSAKIWDTHTGKEILTLLGHPREVTTVHFSPQGREILTGSQDGTAIIWPTRPWGPEPADAADAASFSR